MGYAYFVFPLIQPTGDNLAYSVAAVLDYGLFTVSIRKDFATAQMAEW